MKPNRKLKKPGSSSKLILEEVIGLTTKNANGLASNICSSKCVYAAGGVVVVYDVESGTQSHLMASNRTPKPLSCVSISKDGSLVAAGESGYQPAVLLWDLARLAFLSELKSHQHGVACIAFSPDGKHLVSVGFPQDGYICLWHWRSGILVTKLKACSSCSSVESVGFLSDPKFFVTAGKKHLKFWTIGSAARPRADTGSMSLKVLGKPINLVYQKGCSFVAVTSPILLTSSSLVNRDKAGEILPVYALTEAGVLYLLHSALSIRNSVDLKVKKAFALSTSNKLVACACNNGVVKLFTMESLEYCGSLEYTEVKRCKKEDDIDCHGTVSKKNVQLLPTLPHAIACQFSNSEKLVVVYGDHSLYIWDIQDLDKATRCCVLVSHSACIWDIKNLPCENMHAPSLACGARGCSGGVSFATCSADGTIRLWDLALQHVPAMNDLTLATSHSFLLPEPAKALYLVSAGTFERDSVELGSNTSGFRSIAISSDGKHLAAGDCQGNLHVYNLYTSDYLCFQGTHDAEITSLSFSLSSENDIFSKEMLESHYFLASGGRDRSIHLYDVERNFDMIGSVTDYSAAVTCVQLTSDGSKILICSADRSLVFHDVTVTDADCKISHRNHQMASYGTVCDMAVDPSVKITTTVGQDKKINTVDIASGKLIRSFKQDEDFGDPIKVILDPSCSFLVCSYCNKSICMYDFFTGEIVARAVGHGEVVTGLIFLPDCKHIVSVAGDGCIFVWEVPVSLSVKMLQKIKENSRPFLPTSTVQPVALNQIKFHEEGDHQFKISHEGVTVSGSPNPISERHFCQRRSLRETSAFKFSISRLPRWARVKGTSPDIMDTEAGCSSSQQVGLEEYSTSVGSHGVPDVQTPSKHDPEGSKPFLGSMSKYHTDTSEGPLNPQETHRKSFSLDGRWLTIHTVCFDLLNSPGVWDMKDMKALVTVPSMSKDPWLEMTSKVEAFEVLNRDPSMNNSSLGPSFAHSNRVDGQGAHLTEQARLSTPGSASHRSYHYGINNASASQEMDVSEVLEQFQSETTESEVQEMADVSTSSLKSQERDLFHQNVGNLSPRMKTGERNSSKRRSYSARFFLHRDLLRGHKQHFGTRIGDFGSESITLAQKATSHVVLENSPILVLEETQMTDTCEQPLQDLKNLMPKSLSSGGNLSQNDSAGDNSGNTELVNPGDQQNRVIACKEALRDLEAAAENAFQLFSKLVLASRGEVSRGSEAELCSEATEMLPSIAKKVHATAKLVSPTNSPGQKTDLYASSIEPLLGKFAESLSQRVVEILKKNSGPLT